MATGQTILDLMEGLDRELLLQTGQADVTLGLKLVNAAQDYFESLAALHPGLLGDDIGTVTTSASTESTAFPSGVLRIDRLQFIDAGTSRPAWDLERVSDAGGHFVSQAHPLLQLSSTVTGKPVRYWTDGSNIYWDPLPDATHTVRYYGFAVASDITAGGTFAYPDILLLPIATFAVRLFAAGKDDVDPNYQQLGIELFDPAIQTLSRFNRDRAKTYAYTRHHDT